MAGSWNGASWGRGLEVTRQAFLLGLRGRMLGWFAVGALALAVVIYFLEEDIAARDLRGDELYGLIAYIVLLQFAVPFSVTYLAVSAVHGDLEDRTATYLFVRPIPRPVVLVGKWAAATVLGWLLAALACGVLFAAVRSLPRRIWFTGVEVDVATLAAFTTAAAMAVPVYAAVGAAFGAIFKRPLVVTAVFVVGWEFIVSNFVPPQAGVRNATVMDPVRRWLIGALDAPPPELERVLVLPFERFSYGPEALGRPEHALAELGVVALVAAMLVYSRREYESRPRD